MAAVPKGADGRSAEAGRRVRVVVQVLLLRPGRPFNGGLCRKAKEQEDKKPLFPFLNIWNLRHFLELEFWDLKIGVKSLVDDFVLSSSSQLQFHESDDGTSVGRSYYRPCNDCVQEGIQGNVWLPDCSGKTSLSKAEAGRRVQAAVQVLLLRLGWPFSRGSQRQAKEEGDNGSCLGGR